MWEFVMKKKDESFEFCDLYDVYVFYSNWNFYFGIGMVLSLWVCIMMVVILYGVV